MAKCEVCGNDYENSFEIRMQGDTYTFDSFECAIHRLAPACPHCEVKVVGHGIQANGNVYCCAHCARAEGVTTVVDNEAHAGR